MILFVDLGDDTCDFVRMTVRTQNTHHLNFIDMQYMIQCSRSSMDVCHLGVVANTAGHKSSTSLVG